MMVELYPTYTLWVEVQDGVEPNPNQGVATLRGVEVQASGSVATQSRYKFYFPYSQYTGCDVVLKAVCEALDKAGMANVRVTLERFELKARS